MRFAILIWVFSLRLGFEGAAKPSISDRTEMFALASKAGFDDVIEGEYSLYFLLRPFKIPADLFCSFRSICEICSGAFEPSLCELLKLSKLALFGVEFA